MQIKRSKLIFALATATLSAAFLTTTVKADDTNPTDQTQAEAVNQNNNQTSNSSTTSPTKQVDYFKTNPKIIRLKHEVTLYKNAELTNADHDGKKGYHYLISSLIKNNQGQTVLKANNDLYLLANTANIAKVKGYQNPKRYHQVHYTQIKPYGKVGYNLYRDYEGIKTWKVMHRMDTWNGRNNYNQATWNAVRRFQRRHHLKATGNVNKATWVKMGFSKKSWTGIDSYIAPLDAQAWQGRRAHIDAMIHQAYKYMGKPWLAGCSSSPAYGVDCSGLVMQALYAGGISPIPTSSIGHAHPGNEWNSRNLWADRHLKRVAYNHRERGDLVFYYQPGTHTIWHIAIYLGHNRVIESWPPRVMVSAIRNGQRSDIAGIKRPFI